MTAPISPIDVPPSSQELGDHIDLHKYWRTIKKRRGPIVGILLLSALFSLLIAFTITPVYQSTVTLYVEPTAAKVVSIEEVVSSNLANREYLESQYEILRSRTIVEMAINRVGLDQHPDFQYSKKKPWYLRWFTPESQNDQQEKLAKIETRDRLYKKVRNQLTIEPVRRTQLIKIRFEDRDPRLAADVANAVAQAYIENELEVRVSKTQKANQWLSERLEELQLKQAESEKALKEYLVQQPTSLFESLPEVLNNPTIQRQKELEAETLRKISELSKQYGQAHPKMLALKDELEATRRNIQREIRTITTSLASDFDPARTGGKGNQRIERSDNSNPLQKTTELHTLQREIVSNRHLYNLFLDRIKETKLLGNIHSTNAHIVDPALPALYPIKPRKTLIVGLSTMISLFFVLLIAFLLEYLENTLKTASDVESKLGLPTLGIVPLLAKKDGDELAPAMGFLKENKSAFAESIRTIRTGVMLSALDEPHKILLVTSSVPGEGKTTVAINIAQALAQLEHNVLLIDADMRKPSVGKYFGLKSDSLGLSNLVAGTAKKSECIHSTKGGLDVISSGIIPPNPLELLSSRRFEDLLQQLGERYTRIVIDSAPMNEVSDAQILSTKSSGLLFVTKSDATPYQVANVAVKRLRAAKAHIIGVVLNMVDMDKLAKWDTYGGYYTTNYGYYGYGQAEEPPPQPKPRAVR